MTEQVWTIKDVIQWSGNFLKTNGSESPRLDAELLLAHVLDCRRLDLYLDHHKPLLANEKKAYRELIKRRAAGEPVAYILGSKDFFGFSFQVSSETLIPRPDTELLVEKVLEHCSGDSALMGLDIGTGTGCIAISIKKHRPLAEVWAWDKSLGALAIARSNAARHGIEVRFEEVDALDPCSWQVAEDKFDFIVSNPPYIAPSERAELAVSVIKYEPEMALFAPENGLAFYQMMARHAASLLKQGGKIFLEIGYRQAHDVCSILDAHGWNDISAYCDLAGHQRVIVASRCSQ